MRTLVPGYPAVQAKLEGAAPAQALRQTCSAARRRLLAARAAGLDLFALDAPHLFARPGNPYLGPDGRDWPDNALRFAALARVGADIGRGAIAAFAPDVVHVHDWQAALAPAYLHYDGRPRPGTVITVHNLAFQGHFPADVLPRLGLPANAMSIDGVEYFGGVGFLKAGLRLSDRITTVSPTYAREIMTPEFGMALDGLLRARASDVDGIVNGIDDNVWNPATDPTLAQNYSAVRIDLRVAQQDGAAAETRSRALPRPPAIRRRLAPLQSKGARSACSPSCPTSSIGADNSPCSARGKPRSKAASPTRRPRRPGAVACVFGYDEGLCRISPGGRRLHSRSLALRALRPHATLRACATARRRSSARVGGLADTIIDANEAAMGAGVATGIQFAPPAASELAYALERAFALFADAAALRRMRLNGMRADVSWRGPAKRYASLYRAIARSAA